MYGGKSSGASGPRAWRTILGVGNVRQLFQALGERYPQLRDHLKTAVAASLDDERRAIGFA